MIGARGCSTGAQTANARFIPEFIQSILPAGVRKLDGKKLHHISYVHIEKYVCTLEIYNDANKITRTRP